MRRFIKRRIRWLHDLIWWVKYRTTHRYHVLNLGTEPGYSDVMERLVHANFALLVSFMEIEYDTVRWDADEPHATASAEMQRLYKWYKEVYPHYPEHDPILADDVMLPEREFVPCRMDDNGEVLFYEWRLKPGQEEADKAFSIACEANREWEAKRDKEIEENLISLIKLRQFLWT